MATWRAINHPQICNRFPLFLENILVRFFPFFYLQKNVILTERPTVNYIGFELKCFVKIPSVRLGFLCVGELCLKRTTVLSNFTKF